MTVPLIHRTPHRPIPPSGGGGGGGNISLPHDPSFIGPSYWAKFSSGPSSSPSYFPVFTYQINLDQWSGLSARVVGMGVNGHDAAYDGGSQASLDHAASVGLKVNIEGSLSKFTRNLDSIIGYAMADEPNQAADTRYNAQAGTPTNDLGAQNYVSDADAKRTADPTRIIWGNFTKDLLVGSESGTWGFPPSGWTAAQFEQHVRTQLSALDVVSADYYAWTDNWEWNQANVAGAAGHYGAWVYGHMIDRMKLLAPTIPGFLLIDTTNGQNTGNTALVNEATPNMINAAVWNALIHGARGICWWTYNAIVWCGGLKDPNEQPYTGATYYEPFALYADHQFDPQYAMCQSIGQWIAANAAILNSPTVSGISGTSPSGVPVCALGKDVGGKLWVAVQMDGDATHQLSNTSSTTATVTLPSVIAPGTVLNVVGENRTVTVDSNHAITDNFGTVTDTPKYSRIPLTFGYQKHIYMQQ